MGKSKTVTVVRHMGLNRGVLRVWLQGDVLVDAGLPHGTQWNVSRENKSLFIARAPVLGKRRVAGSPDRPVIDICSGQVLEGLAKPGDALDVAYVPRSGLIEVTKAKG